jgi:Tol biopolymer transport system component
VAVTLLVDNNVDIWLKDLPDGALTRLTTDPSADAFPIWSPDGNQIAFLSNRAGVSRIYVKRSNGGGTEDVLLDAQAPPQDWSRDGRFVLDTTVDPKNGRDIWAVDRLAKPPIRRAVANSSFEERNAQFSPDGRWIAYETNRSGRFEVVAQTFPDGRVVLPVSRAGGTQPRWRADQREIYFLAPGGEAVRQYSDPNTTWAPMVAS